MAASRCFRCALEVSRPAKRIHLSPRSLLQTRSYADVAEESSRRRTQSSTNTPIDASNLDNIESITSQPKRSIPPIELSQTPAPSTQESSTSPETDRELSKPLPPNVVAAFRTPYRHPKLHQDSQPVASVQLRSYSVRNLEFFADFCMRVAFYIKLPATGPVPLPKKIERWTVPRSNFVHKKSQENFERITLRRLITVYEGSPECVELFLAALRKCQFYGVGMKANVWGWEGLDVGSKMDKDVKELEKELDAKLANFGWNNSVAGQKSIQEMLLRQGAKVVGSPATEVRDEIKGAKNVDMWKWVTDDMARR